MKKIVLLSLLLSGCLLAIDSDLDGVDDAQDRCPNTPFADLVDQSGCSVQSIPAGSHYDIILGGDYSQTNYANQEKSNTMTKTLQADYYNGNIWAQIVGSYFNSTSSNYTKSGFNDTLVALYAKSPSYDGLILQVGGGVLLPTYKSGYGNEAADFLGSISFLYDVNDALNFFGGYSYTLVKDKDVPNVALYQNTQAFYAGAGYSLSNKALLTTSYAQSQSIYVGTVPIKTVSAELFYQWNTHWFSMLDYRYGLSDSASKHDASLRLGYYF